MSNKQVRSLITSLDADNGNQQEFISSVRVVARQINAMPFLTSQSSVYRQATRDDLMTKSISVASVAVKVEPQVAKPGKGKASSAGDSSDSDSEQKQTAASQQPAQTPSVLGSGSQAQPIIVNDLIIDDLEAELVGDFKIFLAINPASGDQEREPEADTKIRMKLYHQLMLSTPHHKRKVRTCVEGDCYGYLRLVLINIIVTGQSRYKSIIALSAIKFGVSTTIADLDNALKEVQAKANRFKIDTIDEDVLKGALLSHAQTHSRYSRLAVDFSKRSSVLTYDKIIQELKEHEANSAPQHAGPPKQAANFTSEDAMTELAAALHAFNKPKTKTSLTQACRNFAKGKCTRGDRCPYSHSDAKAPKHAAKAEEEKGTRKMMTCFNCQKLGTHIASECTAPRQERRRPRRDNPEQASNTDEVPALKGSSVDVATFLKLLKTCTSGNDGASDDETAYTMYEDDLDLDASAAEADVTCEEQEAAAIMFGSQYRGDVTGDGASSSELRGASPTTEVDAGKLLRTYGCRAFAHTPKDQPAPHCVVTTNQPDFKENRCDDLKAWIFSLRKERPGIEGLPGTEEHDAHDELPPRMGDSAGEPESDDGEDTPRPADSDDEEYDEEDGGQEVANALTELAYRTSGLASRDPRCVLLDSAASSHYLLGGDAALSDNGRIELDPTTNVSGAQHGSSMQCLGKMTCKLDVKGGTVAGGTEIKLNRVILLPDTLRNRLVSVGQLTRDGHQVMFADNRCLVTRDGNVIAVAKRTTNNLYPLHISNFAAGPRRQPQSELANLTTDDEDFEECNLASSYYAGENFAQNLHIKFNHMSVSKGTAGYTKLAAAYGRKFTECPKFTCMDCMVTKVHRLPHPQRSKAAREMRDGGGKVGRLAMDAFAWPYAGDKGEKVGTIITDRRLLVPIATRTRSEIPGRVISLIKQMNKTAHRPAQLDVANEIFKVTFDGGDKASTDIDQDLADIDLAHIKYLKTDGAAEFMGGELTEFCDQYGIEKKASCGHTQQQNPGEPAVKLVTQGIAVLHRQLPLRSKWVYAFRFYCHVYGFLPHSGVPPPYDTPYEAMHETHVDFKLLTKNLHPYGCLCFLHIPKALRAHTHGVDKGIACVFCGFSVAKEGFIVMALSNYKMIDGVWDMFFIEDRFPIAEAHAAQLEQGLAKKPRAVNKKWRGIDLSWAALTAGATGETLYGPEEAEEVIVEAFDKQAVAPEAMSDKAAHDHSEPAGVSQPPQAQEHETNADEDDLPPTSTGDSAILPNWDSMPRLENIAESIRMEAEVAPSTLEQIRGAIKASNQTPKAVVQQAGNAPRRSSRVRQPSAENLIAIANLPPSAPTPTAPAPSITDEDPAIAPPRPPDEELEPENGENQGVLNIKECALLACIQEEAEAAYAAANSEASISAPERYSDAMSRTDKIAWVKAMRAHIMKLKCIGVGVYALVPREQATNVMKSTWVYARKPRAHFEGGEALEDSARVVAGGYSQEYGVDYIDTYAPTMPLESYKINEAEALNSPDEVVREVADLHGAYYHSFPTLAQYMEQPLGFGETPESAAAIDLKSDVLPELRPIPGARARFVWELLRCMPGTKDAGHNFNQQLTAYLVKKLGLKPNSADGASFYGKFKDGSWIRLNCYVDDLTVFASSQALVDYCMKLVDARFPCKRKAGINLIVGINVVKTEDTVSFDQKRLIDDVALYTGQMDELPVLTPYPSEWAGFSKTDCVTDPEARAILDKWPYPNALGKVAHIARGTRYDVMWLVSVLQRHYHNYGPAMINMLLRLIRYMYTTRTKALVFHAGYPKNLPPLVTMVDASYASSLIDRTSHEGIIVFYKGCPVHASSKRQKTVALSSMESEFMAANTAGKLGLWLIRLIEGFGMEVPVPFPIMEDNTATIYLSQKASLNGPRTRHMDTRWHWLQEKVSAKLMILRHLRTQFQVADVLTKGVDNALFLRLSAVLQGQVPVWLFGEGALQRALSEDNNLSLEGLRASKQRMQNSQRPSTAAQEAAVLKYGSTYSGDVTGDGAGKVPCEAQEAAALMYGSAYRGDVTGDGAAEHCAASSSGIGCDREARLRDEFGDELYVDARAEGRRLREGYAEFVERTGQRPFRDTAPTGPNPVLWPELRTISARVQPHTEVECNTLTERALQLTSNAMGSRPGTAEALLRHVMGDFRYIPGPGDVENGVGELQDVISIAAAMVYVVATKIVGRAIREEADDASYDSDEFNEETGLVEDSTSTSTTYATPPPIPVHLIQGVNAILAGNLADQGDHDDMVVPFLPPEEDGPAAIMPPIPLHLQRGAAGDEARRLQRQAIQLRRSRPPLTHDSRICSAAVYAAASSMPVPADPGMAVPIPLAYPVPLPPAAPPARPVLPTHGPLPMRRADFFDRNGAQHCAPGQLAWSIPTSCIISATNKDIPSSRDELIVGVMRYGKRFHHVQCSMLMCKGGAHKGVVFHGGVILQTMGMVRQFNIGRAGDEDELTKCKICECRFPAG
jgi:hypothetical protein